MTYFKTGCGGTDQAQKISV